MKQNQTYTFRINIGGKLLTYLNCKVVSFDDNFVTFLDKYNKEVSINKKNIESYEEVTE